MFMFFFMQLLGYGGMEKILGLFFERGGVSRGIGIGKALQKEEAAVEAILDSELDQ